MTFPAGPTSVSVTSFKTLIPVLATDSQALQLAFNAAKEQGVSPYIPPGIYTLSIDQVIIDGSLHIYADPKAIIQLSPGNYASGGNMLKIQNANGVVIEGGVWDFGSNPGSNTFAINVVNSSNITFRNATFKNAIWGCIQTTDTGDVLVEGCKFLNNAGGDVNVICAARDVDNITVRNCVHRCPASNYEAVNIVNLSGGTKKLTNITIDGNNIVGSSTPTVGSCGIQIWANANNYAPGPFTITNNYVYGFEIGYSPAFCTNGVVTGNIAQACKTIGFEMAGAGIVCAGNSCIGDGITQYAFTTDGAPGNNFSGNTARNFTLYGFSVTNGGSDNAVFTGCHAYSTHTWQAVSAFAFFGVNGVTMNGCHSNMPNSTGGLGVYAVDVGKLNISGCSFEVASGTLGHIYIDNSAATVRDHIKIKSNTFVGAITGTNVRQVGASFGSNVAVEQT